MQAATVQAVQETSPERIRQLSLESLERWYVGIELSLESLTVPRCASYDTSNQSITPTVHRGVDEGLGQVSGLESCCLLVVGVDVSFQDLLGVLTTVIEVVCQAA